MKQYAIYIRRGSSTPYILQLFDNIFSAKCKLFEIIELEEERGRPYFVDNDFFENKFYQQTKLTYFCIKEREISEWKNYSEKETKNKNITDDKKYNNIIYLRNFK